MRDALQSRNTTHRSIGNTSFVLRVGLFGLISRTSRVFRFFVLASLALLFSESPVFAAEHRLRLVFATSKDWPALPADLDARIAPLIQRLITGTTDLNVEIVIENADVSTLFEKLAGDIAPFKVPPEYSVDPLGYSQREMQDWHRQSLSRMQHEKVRAACMSLGIAEPSDLDALAAFAAAEWSRSFESKSAKFPREFERLRTVTERRAEVSYVQWGIFLQAQPWPQGNEAQIIITNAPIVRDFRNLGSATEILTGPFEYSLVLPASRSALISTFPLIHSGGRFEKLVPRISDQEEAIAYLIAQAFVVGIHRSAAIVVDEDAGMARDLSALKEVADLRDLDRLRPKGGAFVSRDTNAAEVFKTLLRMDVATAKGAWGVVDVEAEAAIMRGVDAEGETQILDRLEQSEKLRRGN